MSVKLRLQRHGTKKRPFYRLVAADSRSVRDGAFLEIVGTYNPLTQPETLSVKAERVKYWLDRGALPTDTVRTLLKKTPQSA
jgi:small subunit ribosomal protein S16